MTGGIVPDEVQERLFEEGWTRIGYAVCWDCLEGRSSLIAKPPVRDFLGCVAEFFGGDVAEHTFGCRAAQFTVMKTISDYVKNERPQDYAKVVIADPLCHYTTGIAAEMTGFRMTEPPYGGYPEYKVDSYSIKVKMLFPEGVFADPAHKIFSGTGDYEFIFIASFDDIDPDSAASTHLYVDDLISS